MGIKSQEKKRDRHLSRLSTCRIMALFLAVIFTAGLFGACGRRAVPLKTENLSDEQAEAIWPSEYHPDLHVIHSEQLQKVAASGLIELYFDPETYAVAVKETSMNQFWYALPATHANREDNRGVSVLNIELARDGDANTYLLNSQDNSVAFGSTDYETTDTGLTVTYSMADTQETAQKTADAVTREDIRLTVSITYTLRDGSLFTSVALEPMPDKSNVLPVKLGVLEYFGATAQAQSDDFILLPDGSGSLLYTGVFSDSDTGPVVLPVYGADIGLGLTDEGPAARVGVYGMKQGKSAFAVILEEGEALATIRADRAEGETGYHHVGATYALAPEVYQADKDQMTRYVARELYQGQIQLCYRFLPGNTATYPGMAIACREQLIRDGMLSTQTVKQEEYLPLNLTVIGAATREKKLLGLWNRTVKLTTFMQAQDMVTQMKAKGVNNIYLRYQGALSGGLDQKTPIGPNLLMRLGGKADFNALSDYMTAQKLSLYLDVHLISSRESGLSEGKSVQGIDGKTVFAEMKNTLYPAVGPDRYPQRLLHAAEIPDTTLELLQSTRRLSMTGYCVGDAGNWLYSDLEGGTDRQTVADTIAAQNEPLSMNQSLMVSDGNLYMLKSADVIVDLPLDAYYEDTASYEAIPFLQMLLHGIVDYSGAPINLQEDSTDAMLRAIEYGACPSYEWIYDDSKLDESAAAPYQYEQWLTQAARYYEKADAALGDLRDARMTRHEKVQDGVYLTEYGGSSLIYVNYSDVPVTVDGVTVAAQSFIRIN